jgi:tetratricopeptide (TPR) repeat protein
MVPPRRARFSSAAPSIAIVLALAALASVSRADPPKAGSTGAASTTSAADEAKEKRERQARAVDLHNEAKALYERGLYRRAITKLEAALALDPDGKELVYNLALIHEKLAEADIAEGYYLRYIDMESDPKARERALAIVKRLQGAKLKLKADLAERATATVSASAAPSASASAGGPAPVSRMPSPMVFVIGGVAVAALGVGIGFGVSALATQPVNASTGPKVTAYDLEMRARSAHTQAVIADLAIGTSVVIGLAASLLYLLETRSARPAPAAALVIPTKGVASAVSPRAASLVRVEAPF